MALRQSRRRAFNERLAALDPDGEVARFRCECGLVACGMAIRMSADDYTELREHPRRLAVHPEHVADEADRVVAARAGWVVVETSRSLAPHVGVVDPVAARAEQHR